MSGFGSATTPPAGSVVDPSTPWVAAADGNLPLLIQSLQQLNLTISAADQEQNYTILQAAASYSQLPIMNWIQQQQQQQQQSSISSVANAVDKDGDSALHYASTADAAKLLVEQFHIDVNIRNGSGLTALEAKQQELDEMLQDEDTDDDDIDIVHLKGIIEYLQSLSNRQQ